MDFGISPEKTKNLLSRMANLGILESDLIEQFIRSSGPGGQHVNKTSTCVYLKHKPTGLEVKMQQERSQPLNRYRARHRLCDLYEEKVLGRKTKAQEQAEKIRKQKLRRKRRSRNTTDRFNTTEPTSGDSESLTS